MTTTNLDRAEVRAAAPRSGTGAALIRLRRISKVFYTDQVETHALRGVDLDVREGEYLAIAGPSGGGKTTLLSVLGLLDTPTDGTYLLDGKPVSGLTASQRAHV